jgi:hypothetical protein
MRLCIRCRYDLRDLPAGPCPECGQRFDPADARTYLTSSEASASRWLFGLSLAAALLPLLCWLSLHLTWLVAILALGHQPRPSIDDPKDIAAIVPFYWLTLILMMLSPLAIGGLLLLPLSALSRHQWRRIALRACLAVFAIVLGVALLRWDPVNAGVWFMD